jgi:hypothetical protein
VDNLSLPWVSREAARLQAFDLARDPGEDRPQPLSPADVDDWLREAGASAAAAAGVRDHVGRWAAVHRGVAQASAA